MSNTSEIKINTDNLNTKCPVYSKYPGQFYPQPAYVEIDPGQRTVCADYSGEIGNAMPMAVWHGRIIRVSIPPESNGPSLAAYLTSDPVLELIARICAGHDERWNGNNWIGTLDDAATEALEALENDLPGNVDMMETWDVDEWLFAICGLRDHWDDQPLAEAVAELEGIEDANQCVIGDIEDALIQEAAGLAKAELWDRLTRTHIDELLQRGEITDADVTAWKGNQ